MTDEQKAHSELCQAHGLLNAHKGTIIADIGPMIFGVMVACLAAQRDKVKARMVAEETRDGRAT